MQTKDGYGLSCIAQKKENGRLWGIENRLNSLDVSYALTGEGSERWL